MDQAQDEAQDWQTPPEILELVREVLGCQIGLDPCTTIDNPTNAKVFFTPADDGLFCNWDRRRDRGGIFMNPPYGRGIGNWTAKLLVAPQERIGLIPARTDTRWWHRDVIKANAICFVHGRIRFIDARTKQRTGAGKFPSALPYYGKHASRFSSVFASIGWVVRGDA